MLADEANQQEKTVAWRIYVKDKRKLSCLVMSILKEAYRALPRDRRSWYKSQSALRREEGARGLKMDDSE